MFERIFPAKLYEGTGGEVTKVLSAPVTLTASTNNQTVITGVAGKRIRVMGLIGFSDSTSVFGRVFFKDGNAGTMLLYGVHLPTNNVGNQMTLPITNSGYFETSTGIGLFADLTTAAASALTIFYIVYTPD